MANKIISLKKNNSITVNCAPSHAYLDLSMNCDRNNSTIGTSNYKIKANVDTEAVKQSLRNIFTWIPGERILFPEFGNKLYSYIYEGINKYNIEQIFSEITSEIFTYEPRVIVDDLQTITSTDDIEDNTLNIKIIYHIKGLPEKSYKDYIII